MGVEHIAIVLHHSRASSTAAFVLVGIANHAGDGGAWPSVATLAKYVRKSERQVQRAIEELIKLGEVARYIQQGGPRDMRDRDRPNRYEILLTCPPWCDGTAKHNARRGWRDNGDGTYRPPPPPGWTEALDLDLATDLDDPELVEPVPAVVDVELPSDPPTPPPRPPAKPAPAELVDQARAELRRAARRPTPPPPPSEEP